MDKQQKLKKEYREHCQCCGRFLGININNVDFNLFGFIMSFMNLFSFAILVLYFPLTFFSFVFEINIFNEKKFINF
ncbi:hypothetical protein [Candidatus Phytoplasma tritici]|uniref:hypothetical protein n=1 Tax=Candidatus Phytoplasma tritici TaxID=321961 RepID=UPI00040ECB8D|nr:hypothetical protein [Candidatus Phytoplasma tritici]